MLVSYQPLISDKQAPEPFNLQGTDVFIKSSMHITLLYRGLPPPPLPRGALMVMHDHIYMGAAETHPAGAYKMLQC